MSITEGISHATVLGAYGLSTTIGSETVNVLMVDPSDNILVCTGTTQPTDGGLGYAKGCLFIQTDVTSLSTIWYINVGKADDTGCNFDSLGSGASGTPTAITIAEETSDTTCFPAFFTASSGDLGPKIHSTKLLFNASTGNLTATSFTGSVVAADYTTAGTSYVLFATGATGSALKTNTGMTFAADSGTLTCTAFVGDLTGNVTGNCSGSSGSCTGNAATASTAGTVTTAAQPAITSVGTLTSVSVDNIHIDGNTISSTGGTNLNITPLAGQQIVLDGVINIDAGVVTAVESITVDNITIDGNTITADTGALNLTPHAGSAIVLDGTINIDAGVVTGATSISSTIFVGEFGAGAIDARELQNAAADLGPANVDINLGNTNGAYVTNITIDGTMTAATLAGEFGAGSIDARELQNAAADLGDADVSIDLSNSHSGRATHITIDGTMTAGTLAGSGASITAGSIKASSLQAAAADLGAANVTIDLSNTNGSYVTNVTIDGAMTAASFSGSASGLTAGSVKANALQAAAADLGAADVTIDLGNTNGAYVTNVTTDGTVTALKFAGAWAQTPTHYDDTAAPSVVGKSVITVDGAGGGTAMTGLTGGVAGQVVVIVAVTGTGTVTATDGANFQLAGGGNFAMGVGDVLTMVCTDGTHWYEVSRSDN